MQPKFDYGPELGISFYKRSINYNETKREAGATETTTQKNKSLVSPIFGVYGQIILKKHLLFSSGLQYQMIGDIYQKFVEGSGNYQNNIINYKVVELEEIKLHKLCFPLIVGYTLKLGKIKPSIYVGFRPNLFLTGKYYYKEDFFSTNGTITKDTTTINTFNPFKSDEAEVPLKKLKMQKLVGFSLLINEQLKISFTYNFGKLLEFVQHIPFYEPTGHYTTKYIYNRDFTISAIYFINSWKKELVTTE